MILPLINVVFPHLAGSVKWAQLAHLTGQSSGSSETEGEPPSPCGLVGTCGPQSEGGLELGNRGHLG